jgi:outer membrane protein OmpA-like peptidoglycan-associated protein
MRFSLLLFTALILFTSPAAVSQKILTVRKKEFKAAPDGFKPAWGHLRRGDEYFISGGVFIAKAYDEYIHASVYNSSCAKLNYNIGLASLLSDNKADAAGYFRKAMALDSEISKDIHLLTGQALHFSGNFEEAITELNNYINSGQRKKEEKLALARKEIEECRSAAEIVKDTLKIGISNPGVEINTFADEYSQVLTSDGLAMYFGSRRALPNFSDYYKDSKFDENIFVAYKTAIGWSQSSPAGSEITTKYCESPLFLNSDGTLMFIYAGYENGGDIMQAVKTKGEWGPPRKIDYKINTSKKETSFAISPGGSEICFVSEAGKPNLGGKDIFMIRQKPDGRWSDPENMGVGINTEWDEESVGFSVTGDTLWFSSRGHNTMGGFDIFYSVRTKAGGWAMAVNGGYPLNSQFDELFYLPSVKDDSLFFFASNRSDGFGGLDIYEGRILPPPRPEPVIPAPEPVKNEPEPVPVIVQPAEVIFFIKGRITDSETAVPVSARIDVLDISTNQVVASATSSGSDGSYSVKVPEKRSYLLELRSQGFLSDLRLVQVPAAYEGEMITFNATLARVKVGKKVVLNNILFESGKDVLTQSSYSELNRLLAFMQDNPAVKVEISGHTDITGGAALNLRLSNDRARAVVNYLVGKGISSSRITYRGYGSSQPVATNSTPAGRAKNRRVELKILEI